ncbi:Fmp10p PWA37_003596 [Arxiozyma heterogenica]|uniref:Thioesterase domain-containing protein n=1 Tax=Arxiozyma heterogenica TaxID=278026 RepID=A0AAN7WJF3_9SACH|nr:hypothetical protein RI543_000992 [Kazachstania heterogenica]
MFKSIFRNNIKRFSSTGVKYAENATKDFKLGSRGKTSSSMKQWIPISIFGGSFLFGWYLTKHMTFTDLMAYLRYDSLPQDALEVEKYKGEVLARLENLSIVKQLNANGYVEIHKPDMTGQVDGRKNRLVLQSLLSPGAIAIPPRFYYNPTTKDTVGIYHLGMKLTGYPFIVHGGILATILEDLMRESVKFVLDKKGEKIKDLKVSYRMPTLANQFVIVRTTSIEQNGKTVKLKADVMNQSGQRVLVQGSGSFKI